MNMRHEDGAIGFGERFARNSMWGMAGIGMFCAVAVVMQGAVFPFLAVVLTMALSHWFRRRAMQEQRRRNETLEDERDRAVADGRFGGIHRGIRACLPCAAPWPPPRGNALRTPRFHHPP